MLDQPAAAAGAISFSRRPRGGVKAGDPLRTNELPPTRQASGALTLARVLAHSTMRRDGGSGCRIGETL
jgi:hypothetical protein